jgi:hypothetical protein
VAALAEGAPLRIAMHKREHVARLPGGVWRTMACAMKYSPMPNLITPNLITKGRAA